MRLSEPARMSYWPDSRSILTVPPATKSFSNGLWVVCAWAKLIKRRLMTAAGNLKDRIRSLRSGHGCAATYITHLRPGKFREITAVAVTLQPAFWADSIACAAQE